MTMQLKDLGKAVLATEYAVRGPIVARAQELEKLGREVIYCNIGNPQSLGQRPITYVRQLLALCEYPELLTAAPGVFPSDVLDTARAILEGTRHGLGAYSESRGVRFIREAVARFIEARDGAAVDPDHIYLTDGASKGVQSILKLLIASPTDGIMIPIPQYPLYSATITLYEGRIVPYGLDEADHWRLNPALLEASLAKAQAEGTRVKAICVINPGNPTGAVLDAANIAMVLEFARKHGLSVLADEVYQENIYLPGDTFVSFAKVLHDRGIKDVSLFSFHSCSKGFQGECGVRGGYFDHRNVPADVAAQILKLQSVSLCANLAGQVATYAMVNPPRPGTPSHALFQKERGGILESMKQRAVILAEGLNRIEGITCNVIAGAMYAFPRVELPPGVNDEAWCMALLEATGICVVPGSGFGQAEGTAHFRTTILPPTDKIRAVVEKLGAFHREFAARV
ncbi:aminotransferase class I/II-fold pyridoxal phosphate-dependent enzyme [Mesoterricola silvestris]|uniref:Aminotransferase AlaT n=1 Tax=Mesoterricola silvestris TaxID=2927979 RepID=A0AA48KAW1_9BACT|nr:aminotransferase class I/II-fold pyridoxal phosphate-dependent enzyme [Mesoterricola silvestris]BDU71903.1 aminotransferase AlaT [Mesoterricola silvestris]